MRPSTLSMLPPADHVLADVDYRLAVGALRTHDRVAQAEQPGVGCRPGTPPPDEVSAVLCVSLSPKLPRAAVSGVRMKRDRPADGIKRLAIKTGLQALPSRMIALGLSYQTVSNDLGNSGPHRVTTLPKHNGRLAPGSPRVRPNTRGHIRYDPKRQSTCRASPTPMRFAGWPKRPCRLWTKPQRGVSA